MARISSYPRELDIADNDAWIGTESLNRSTKNFTAATVAKYLNINGKISISAQMGFKFILNNSPANGEFSGPADNSNIGDITTLQVSSIDTGGQNTVQFMGYLIGSDILISKQNDINTFGHFTISSYVANGAGVYTLSLALITGGSNGILNKNVFYDFAVFTLSTKNIDDLTYNLDVPTGTTSINLAGSDGTNDAVELFGGTNIGITRDNANRITFTGNTITAGTGIAIVPTSIDETISINYSGTDNAILSATQYLGTDDLLDTDVIWFNQASNAVANTVSYAQIGSLPFDEYNYWVLSDGSIGEFHVASTNTAKILGGTYITSFGSAADKSVTITHNATTRTNTTPNPTLTPSPGGTVGLVTAVTSNTEGHVTGTTTTDVTWPADTDTNYILNKAAGSTDLILSADGTTQNTIQFAGTTNEVTVTGVTEDAYQIGLPDEVTIATSLTVGGTVQSSFGGQVTIPATPSVATDAASKSYVLSQVGGLGTFQGGYDATSDPGSPVLTGISNIAVGTGDFYTVTTAGAITFSDSPTGDATLEVGDFIFANSDIVAGSNPASTDYTLVLADQNIAGAGTTDGNTAKGIAGFNSAQFSVSPTGWVQSNNNGTVTGTGVANKVAYWTSATNIDDGPITFSTNDSTFAGNVTAQGGVDITGTNNTNSTLRLTNTAAVLDNSWSLVPQYNNPDLTLLEGATTRVTFKGGSGNVIFTGSVTAPSIASTDTSGRYFMIQNAAGNQTYPVYSFRTDGNTGMMNPGADILSLVTGGTTRLTINNSSSTFAGNIYLADGTQRNIIGPTNQTLGIFARPNNASEGIIFSTDGGSTTEMFIQDGGNVGINEDNPDKKLHIVDTSAGAVTYPLRLQNSGTTTGTNVGLIFTTKTSGGGNASCVIRSESEDTSGNNSLVFTTSLGGSTSEKMRITSAGGISFGSTGTAYGASGQVLTSNGNAVPSWQAAGGSSPWTTSGNNIYNNNSGNVGIGYAAPNAKLHVLGNVILDSYSVSDPDSTSRTAYPAAQMLTHYNEANGVSIIGGVGGYAGTGLTIGEESSRSSSYNFIRGVSDTNGGGNAAEEFWVNGVGGSYFAGDMGIGTTTPNAKLDVQGTQGQLFSVTDSLTGSIFAVSDISGVPILDVNSSGVSYFDGKVGIGQTSPESFWLYNNNLVVGDGSGNNGMAIYSGINDRSTLAFMSTYTSSSGLDFEIRVDHNNSSGFIETSFVGDGNDNWMRFEERQFGQDPIIRIGTNTIYSNTGGSGIGSGAMMQFRPDNNNWYSAIAINAEDGGGNAKGFIEMQSNRSSTYQADYFLKFFNYNASEIGSIRVNSSNNNVAFNTSSDYRLKEDLKEFKALETICKIKVYNYTWKDDPSDFRDQGILAHELDELIPQAVSGEKDAIDKDNKILAQGIDYSKIVPHLVQSIQELKAEIEILKNK